jgi:hypothetical protein
MNKTVFNFKCKQDNIILPLKLLVLVDYLNISKPLFVCLMVFNATFNNISVILWRSVLLVEETGVSLENH